MYTNRTYSITCSIILFSSEQEHCIKTLCQCTLILLSLYLSLSLLISPFTPPHRIVTTSPDLFSFPLYTCATHAPHRVHHFGPPNSPGVVSFAPWLRSSLYTLSTPPTHNSDIPTVLPCFHSLQGEKSNYSVWELSLFMLIGSLGGIIGACFNSFNLQLFHWRRWVHTSLTYPL